VLSFPWWLSLFIGFFSLSVEILWVRVVGFGFKTLPFAFSFVLACYLVGIALGAAYGKRLCARAQNLYVAAAMVLAIAALVDALTPAAISTFLTPERLWAYTLTIIVAAGLKSVLFPIAHHLGSLAEGPRVGSSVSKIYFGNIIGATLGPLATGFFALDHLNVDECFLLSGAACLLMSMACVLKSGRLLYIGAPLVAALLLSLFAAQAARPGIGSLGTLAVGGPGAITRFAANRHGVVHYVRSPFGGDGVFGGNVYDGLTSVDADLNANRLDRLYLLALLHPHPRRILVIGLSGGAWVRALEGFPGIERIDVVEINPVYVDLIRTYPDLAPLLADPRLQIHIDDGRRWLKRNPDERFDLIIQNTTYHWRANAGNLLSREYFTSSKGHLNAGGIFSANATGSFDVLATAQAVFSSAYRYANFVYASDHPLSPDLSRLAGVRRPDGKLFVLEQPRFGSVADFLATAHLDPAATFIAEHHADAQVITDDNLVSEYRHGLRSALEPAALLALLPPAAAEFEVNAAPVDAAAVSSTAPAAPAASLAPAAADTPNR